MAENTRYLLGKNKRLKSRKAIEAIFSRGKTFSSYPVRMRWVSKPGTAGLKVGVGVSSRNFKKAVDRNRIKRQMREAYRLKQHDIPSPINEIELFFMYTGKQMPVYAVIEQAIINCLTHLQARELKKNA